MLSNGYRWTTVGEVLDAMAGLPEFPDRPAINGKGAFGNTPLKVAAVWGDPTAIELLLAAGAHIDATNEGGYTALHHAASQGHLPAVRVLVAHGASITVRNDDGRTAVQCATQKEIIEYLSQSGT
jgi:uncharacterized protein